VIQRRNPDRRERAVRRLRELRRLQSDRLTSPFWSWR